MEGENELSSYDDILHMHCMDCFKSMCSEQENCVITRCMYCTTYLHRCKVADHETICLMKQVSCPNVQNGCPIKVVKQEVAKHLATCPANVIHCGMEWNRYPLYSRVRSEDIYTLISDVSCNNTQSYIPTLKVVWPIGAQCFKSCEVSLHGFESSRRNYEPQANSQLSCPSFRGR